MTLKRIKGRDGATKRDSRHIKKQRRGRKTIEGEDVRCCCTRETRPTSRPRLGESGGVSQTATKTARCCRPRQTANRGRPRGLPFTPSTVYTQTHTLWWKKSRSKLLFQVETLSGSLFASLFILGDGRPALFVFAGKTPKKKRKNPLYCICATM